MDPLDNKKQTKFEEHLKEFRLEEAEDLAKILSKKYDAPYQDLSITPINTDALKLIREEDARRANIAPFRIVGKKLHIATATPGKADTERMIKTIAEDAGYAVQVFVVSPKSLENAWRRYKEVSYATETEAGIVNVSAKQVATYADKLNSVEDVRMAVNEILTGERRYITSRLLEVLLAGAVAVDASDIHIEPEDESVHLRYRLDGVLQNILPFNASVHSLLLSRVKLVAGLKINIKEDAQDGRFSIKLGDTGIEVRTSTLPGAYGESIVLRVLNPKSIMVPLEELGMDPHFFKVLEREIKKPSGMILNTGPTGAGKTTTLYAVLRKIKTSKIKIITIEDPVEYHLAGITQTQVDREKGYTFLSGLRASLRQDPDVVMVGEIRDEETASTAINAALTGHLVFSTLHTNNAAGAIPRLIDLNVNPKIIGSAVNLAIAQRLIRKLCEHCKYKDASSGDEATILKKILETIPEDRREGVDPAVVWRAKKCEKCNNAGYKGRVGVFEAIAVDEAVDKMIQTSPSDREIRRAAAPQGILSMRQDGILKVLRGITTIDELQRVLDLGK